MYLYNVAIRAYNESTGETTLRYYGVAHQDESDAIIAARKVAQENPKAVVNVVKEIGQFYLLEEENKIIAQRF